MFKSKRTSQPTVFAQLRTSKSASQNQLKGTGMNLKKSRVLSFATSILVMSASIVGLSAPAANAASAPVTVTFESDDSSGASLGGSADFGGNVSSVVTSTVEGNTSQVGKIVTGADCWSGTTFLIRNNGYQLISDFSKTVTLDLYSVDPIATVKLKLEGTPGQPAREVDVAHAGGGWQTLTFDFSTGAAFVAGNYIKASLFAGFICGGGTKPAEVLFDNVSFPGAVTPDPVVEPPVVTRTAPATLVNFETGDTSGYSFINFGGASATVVTNAPTGGSEGSVSALNLFDQGDCWAGTTFLNIGADKSLISTANPIVKANIFSPAAGKVIKLKLENAANGAINKEADVVSVAGWKTYSFDFTGFNPDLDYNKASIFVNFTCGGGAKAGASWYVDDIAFNGAAGAALTTPVAPPAPVTPVLVNFESSDSSGYSIVDFEGNYSTKVSNAPVGGSDGSKQALKVVTAGQPWSGTTFLNGSAPLLSSGHSTVQANIYAPAAGLSIKLKLENSVTHVNKEVDVTSVAGWNKYTFDFSGFDSAVEYNMATIFFDFFGAKTANPWYLDDVAFQGATAAALVNPVLVNFESTDSSGYALIDFGGNASSVAIDAPFGGSIDSTNALKIVAAGECWAGTTFLTGTSSLLSPGNPTVKVSIYSPVAGKTIKLKLENSVSHANKEVDVTSVAGWNQYTFDFTGFNTSVVYNMASIFTDFACAPGAPAKTGASYYVDDVAFLGATPASLFAADDASAVVTVNGDVVANGASIDVDWGTTSVAVAATTTDIRATYTVLGASSLVTGTNVVRVVVTAANGVTTQETLITVVVRANIDTSVSSITVDGFEVEDNDHVDLEPLTTSVAVGVVTTDPGATYVISGGTGLIPGENDLYITVTAGDGVSVQTYYVVLNVLPNTDTSVSSFTVNGVEVADGDVVDVEAFTESVEVAVTTTDPNATYVVDGDSNLVVGENTLTMTVTAADEATSMDYTVTVVVAPSNDASLNAASVTFVDEAGVTQTVLVVDGDEIYLPSNTQSVDVAVTPTDAEATFEIEGGSDLGVGSNALIITITAPDGEAQEVVTVSLVVAVGDVTTSSFTVNGTEVEDGMVVDLEPGTEFVEVLVETTDPLASTSLEGDTGLVFGTPNHLILTVTSVDGTATATYDVVLNVLPYTDAAIASITVNGTATVEGEVVEVDAGDLDVEVTPANEFATAAVTGTVTNASGYVTLTVTVTAQDGETTETREVEVLASSALEIVAGSVPTDGTIRVGTYAKLTKDQFAGSKVTYQWTNDGEDISGATAYRYLLTADDFGHVIRAKVVATTAGVAKTLISKPVEFEAGIIKKAPTPGLKGKAVVGSTLTAVARTWTTDVELAYQWYADGSAVDGATDETFEITPALVDAAVSVGVTGTLAGYATLEKLSAELTVKPGTIRFTTKPSISGDLLVGETIELDAGALSIEGAEVTYVWSRNGEEFDNTEASYTLTPEDYLKRISVKVVAIAEGYNEAFATVKTRAVKAGTFTDVPTPVISGDAVVGETLTVDLGGDYPEETVFKYVWSRDFKVISGATEELTLTKRDLGKTIRVRVIAIIPGYKSTSVLAEGVAVVAAE